MKLIFKFKIKNFGSLFPFPKGSNNSRLDNKFSFICSIVSIESYKKDTLSNWLISILILVSRKFDNSSILLLSILKPTAALWPPPFIIIPSFFAAII